jgi:hypothetical protein
LNRGRFGVGLGDKRAAEGGMGSRKRQPARTLVGSPSGRKHCRMLSHGDAGKWPC